MVESVEMFIVKTIRIFLLNCSLKLNRSEQIFHSLHPYYTNCPQFKKQLSAYNLHNIINDILKVLFNFVNVFFFKIKLKIVPLHLIDVYYFSFHLEVLCPLY